jgi:hypothetical protein
MDNYTVTYDSGWWNVCINGSVIDGFDCHDDACEYMLHLLRNTNA